MLNFKERLMRFLQAIAGKCAVPEPNTKLERLLAEIAGRMNQVPLISGKNEDIGKALVVGSDGSYCLSNGVTERDAIFDSSVGIHSEDSLDEVRAFVDTPKAGPSTLSLQGSFSDFVRVRNVADPQLGWDAANKRYVDACAAPAATADDEGKIPVVDDTGAYELRSLIPIPTAADEGKVPVAQDDGSYGLETVGGGSGIFFVDVSKDDQDNLIASASVDQVLEAMANGLMPVLRRHIEVTYYSVAYNYDTYAIFRGFEQIPGNPAHLYYTMVYSQYRGDGPYPVFEQYTQTGTSVSILSYVGEKFTQA